MRRYADSEVVRNFADTGRMNVLPAIADQMGLATDENSSLWRDKAMVVLNEVRLLDSVSGHTASCDRSIQCSQSCPLSQAILQSYRAAGLSVVRILCAIDSRSGD